MTDESQNPFGFDIDIKPGDRLAYVGIDGVLRTDRVSQVRYASGQPATRVYPTGWRKFIRAVTPRRWRSPLPVNPPTLPTVSFRTDNPFWEPTDD